MYSPYILRYRYCRHVTLDVFWLKGEKAFRNVETLFSLCPFRHRHSTPATRMPRGGRRRARRG